MKDDLDDAGVLELERKMHRVWAEALAFVWEAQDTKGGKQGCCQKEEQVGTTFDRQEGGWKQSKK